MIGTFASQLMHGAYEFRKYSKIFFEVSVRPELFRELTWGSPRDRDYRYGGEAAANHPYKLETRHARHLQVANNYPGDDLPKLHHRVDSVLGVECFETRSSQVPRKKATYGRIIVHEQNTTCANLSHAVLLKEQGRLT